uniref:Uncharacterized protein n=1 Tax=Anguilla anguilla TaxID=7936 RepID=A0A0E9U2M6_ANGAN
MKQHNKRSIITSSVSVLLRLCRGQLCVQTLSPEHVDFSSSQSRPFLGRAPAV